MIARRRARWGARERADEIELVADELITNALMHTDGPAIVTLRVLPGRPAAAGRGRGPLQRAAAAAEAGEAASRGGACCSWTG